MSRYLTPGKIALIALVREYADHKFPNPAIMPVLGFVLKHLNRPTDASTFNLTPEDLIAATVNYQSSVVGRTVLDLLVIDLWNINCLDALNTFFQELRMYHQRPVGAPPGIDVKRRLIADASPLGMFLRRSLLEFEKLQFHEINSLWYAFARFREPTFPLWKLRPHGGGISADVNLRGTALDDPLVRNVYMGHEKGTKYTVSTEEIERLLEFQVELMQKLGSRVSDDTQQRLRDMISTCVPASHLRHYVNFLNSWRSGDYPGAFDSLHRYFDYTMHTRDRTYYQYALLNLAILQADFGCHRESVLAMQETINAARETKDMACLNFALSWLYHFHRAHPQDCPEVIAARMERESLSLLKLKAKEWGMDHLLSMAYLSETRQILLCGESIPSAFESLLRSSHINTTRQIRNATGSQILLQSTLWSRLGVTQCAWISCEAFLAKYRGCSPAEDLAVALCKSAYILSMRGRFEEAFDRLDQISPESLRSLKINQYWTAYSALIKLRRAVHRDEVAGAELLLQQLTAAEQMEQDCRLEISVTRIEFLMRLGNFTSALANCEQVYDDLVRNDSDAYNRVRLIIMKAEIFVKMGRHSRGLSIAIHAGSTAWRARFMPMLYQAFTVIAGIFVHLEEYEAAYQMLDGIMPQILECEDSFLTAVAFGVLADGQVGRAGTSNSSTWREQCLNKALGYLDRAFLEYSHMQDVPGQKSTISKKIRIHNFLENRALRDDAVKIYRQIERDQDERKNLPPPIPSPKQAGRDAGLGAGRRA